MSTTTPTFNTDEIGQWTDPVEFEVTRERIQQYAAATNDPIAPHVAGDYASPVFAVVPSFGAAGQAAMKVIPPDLLMMVLHGEQDFHFHAPILPDTKLTTRAMPTTALSPSRPTTPSGGGEHFRDWLRAASCCYQRAW